MLVLFLFLCFSHICSQRLDYNASANLTSPNTLQGATCSSSWDTTNTVFCPNNTWAYGFQLTNGTGYGILNIALDCRNQTFDNLNLIFSQSSSQIAKYAAPSTISTLSPKNSEIAGCTGGIGDFLRGYYLRMWCPNNLLLVPQGIVEMMMKCSYNINIATSVQTIDTNATWTNYSACLSGFAVCGYEMKYNTQILNYFYGAVDIGLKCCRVCEYAEGFYFSIMRICDFCDYPCKSCFGTSGNCSDCFDGFLLVGNSCVEINVTQSFAIDLYTNFTLSSDWSHNLGNVNLTFFCSPYWLIGGYPYFVGGSWITRSFKGLPAHFMVRITFRFFKIGEWKPNTYGVISFDSVIFFTIRWDELTTPLFYNSDCGGGNLLTNTAYREAYFPHNTSNLTVNFTINSSTGYWGINRINLETQNCGLTCKTCSIIGCTSCLTNYFLTTNYACQSCDPSCSTCAGSSSNQCLTCKTGLFLQNTAPNSCQSTCPVGYYGDTVTGACKLCDISCQTCAGFGPTQCLTCAINSNLYLQSYIGPSSCNSSCPVRKYSYSGNYTCLNCSSNCSTCSGPSQYECLSCISGCFVQGPTPTICLSTCPIGYYGNSTFGDCQLCDVSCQTCVNSGPTQCMICSSNLYLQSTIGPSSCLTSCPTNSYSSTLNYVCLFCDSSCSTCQGALSNQCYSCVVGLYLQSSSPSTCLSTCPVGYYGDNTTGTCKLCDASCMTCLNVGSNQCLTCSNSSILFLQSNVGPSFCLSSCPSNTFPSTLNHTCLNCDSTCINCTGQNPNQCVSCINGLYLQNQSPNACLSTCPIGLYGDKTSGICKLCDLSCQSCSNAGANQCLTCSNSSALFLQSNLGPSSCLSKCPLNTYPSTINYTCLSCDTTCSKCAGPYQTQCIICNYGLYLQNSSPSLCASTCPIGYYGDSTFGECRKCDTTCQTCSGPGASQCIICSNSSILFLQSISPPSYCLSSCPLNSYPSLNNFTCLSCDASCLGCIGSTPNQCLSCNSGNFLQSNIGPASCQSSCPNNTFPNQTDFTCLQCDESCHSCIGALPTQCISCPTGMHLASPSPSNCINICPIGRFFNLNTSLCEACDPSCLSCNGPGPLLCIVNKTSVHFPNQTNVTNCTPSILNTSDPLVYLLTFSNNYSNIYKQYFSRTKISIDGLNNSLFKFNITQKENTEVFEIDILNIDFSIDNHPLMYVDLDPPPEILLNSLFILNTYKIENTMQYYFHISSAEMSQINQTTMINNLIFNALSNGFLYSGLFLSGSGTSFLSSLTSMSAIRILRHFQVDYPENIVSFLKSSVPMFEIIPRFSMDEDPADPELPHSYTSFAVSKYVFNNCGYTVIQGLCFLAVGLILLPLKSCDRPVLKKISTLFSRFVWNLTTDYFLANYILITFFNILALKYPSIESSKGRFNFFLSILFFTFTILILVFVVVIIRKKKLKVAPIIEPALSAMYDSQQIKSFKITPVNELKISNANHNNSFPSLNQIDDIKMKQSSHIMASEINLYFEGNENSQMTITSKSNFDGILKNSPFSSPEKKKSTGKKTVPFDDFKKSNTIEEPEPTMYDSERNKSDKIQAQNELKMNIPSINRIDDIKMKQSSHIETSEINLDFEGSENSHVTIPSKANFDGILKKSPFSLTGKKDSLEKKQVVWNVPSNDLKKSRTLDENSENKQNETIFKDFKQRTFWESYFLAWSLIKSHLYCFTIVFYSGNPRIGFIFIILIQLMMILSLVIIRPYRVHLEFLQNLYNEIWVFASIVTAYSIFKLDGNENVGNDGKKLYLGKAIVIFNFLLIAGLSLRIFFSWWTIIVKLKNSICKKKMKVSPLQAFRSLQTQDGI